MCRKTMKYRQPFRSDNTLKAHKGSYGGLTLAGSQIPTQPLLQPFSTGWWKKIRQKSTWVTIKTSWAKQTQLREKYVIDIYNRVDSEKQNQKAKIPSPQPPFPQAYGCDTLL